MYCPRCGKETQPEAKFCANCGHNVRGGSLPPPAGLPRTPREDVRGAACGNCQQTSYSESVFCEHCEQFLRGSTGMLNASIMRRFTALLLDIVLVFLTLVIGYFIWSIIVFGNGQTPGKQLLGLRIMREDGGKCGWWLTFLREVGLKGFLFRSLGGITFGIVPIADYLWAMWDEDRQTLHDKLVQTVVVYTG